MNTRIALTTGLLAGLAVATTATAQPEASGRKLEMRDVAKHEDLSNMLRQAEAMNPLNQFKAVEGEARTEVYKPESLLANSDILCFNGLTTLVPKGAILALPDSVKNRVGTHVHGHRLVQFQEFLQANRGWVQAVEVTRGQAQGIDKMPDSVTERVAKASNLIVATFNGGPISVLPPRKDESDENKSDADGSP